ncbi:hypothetical protein AO498_10177 [Algoriphagus sanaruensis]|uniref:Uncharacterized protein n=1 Tax=Algoriphagus sanaruensis TaxID=1727163 RepID=A0A142ENT9_9BACT|nr:hypothetical protein AO498_10177 [Algoriphagus sanaruensis]
MNLQRISPKQSLSVPTRRVIGQLITWIVFILMIYLQGK